MERIQKDDLVYVTTGREKGKTGRVVGTVGERVLVQGLNKVKRHQSPRKFREGGIIEKEAPIHASNIMLVDPVTQKPTRVRFEMVDGKKVRVSTAGNRIENIASTQAE